jgi:hypothetical protein
VLRCILKVDKNFAHYLWSSFFKDFLLMFLAVTLGIDDNQGASIMKKWIRTNFDADGYFLLQLGRRKSDCSTHRHMYSDMYLTADDASSLTIQGM